MSGLDPGTRAGLEEALNALVPEASNHSWNVARGATRSKFGSNPLGAQPGYKDVRAPHHAGLYVGAPD